MNAERKREFAGLLMMLVGIAAYFLDGREAAHTWRDTAGIATWTIVGVVLYVGKKSLELLRGVAAIPGYARREWNRRTSTVVPLECPKCKKQLVFCECPE